MKSKAGRKKGSYSFVIVHLDKLNKVLGKDGFVVMSRKYADSIGIAGQPVITKFHSSESVERVAVNPATVDSSITDSDSPLVNVQDWD